MSPSLALQDVSFRFPDGTEALREVTLEIEGGRRLALVGQNGSGKSTLVRQLNGLLRPTSGRVLIDGRDIADRRVAQLAAIVGLAFQNPDRQIFSRTVGDEVAFGPRNLGRRGEELVRRSRDALAAVELAGLEQVHPYDLGYTQRKLLAIASVLAMDTPVVILDEPTTGQDATGIRLLADLVTRLSAEGRTVIAISHDMRFVAETFERIVVMREGTIVLDGPPAEVFARQNWDTLGTTFLDPPFAARIGEQLGVGATPTEAALVDALRRS
jgi:energy-coupling factor transport system ATP-binding protein